MLIRQYSYNLYETVNYNTICTNIFHYWRYIVQEALLEHTQYKSGFLSLNSLQSQELQETNQNNSKFIYILLYYIICCSQINRKLKHFPFTPRCIMSKVFLSMCMCVTTLRCACVRASGCACVRHWHLAGLLKDEINKNIIIIIILKNLSLYFHAGHIPHI